MASSDDEAEVGPQSVSNYHFVGDDDSPVTFSVLPFRWSESESADEKKSYRIFLRGSADNGLQTIHKEVKAWKFDLLNAVPDISVLTKDNTWIRLQKPRKSFEEIIRTELITVHCLHYARMHPEASGKPVWDYLSKVFSLYDVKPSQNDLVDHMALISEAGKHDASLAKSKFLLTFLEEKPKKGKLSGEDVQITSMSGFIVDDVDGEFLEDVEEDGSNDDESRDVCTICDNGGDLICCDGSCMRSFHATTKKAGSKASNCASLGFTEREVEAIERFYCKNCQYKQHQCFACGELGSSDKSSGAEVFRCANATCGYFYHPRCVAKLLHQEEVAAKELQEKIAEGESFTCPIHKCCVCKQGENKKVEELQFAVCRRCPTSYHRKCLPSDIVIVTVQEEVEEEGEGEGEGEEEEQVEEQEEAGEEEAEVEEKSEARAWIGLLPNRLLLYCFKHEIIDGLGTPIRDVRFPDVEEKKKKKLPVLPDSSGKVLPKKRRLISGDFSSGDAVVKKVKGSSSGAKQVTNIKKSDKISSESHLLGKLKETDASRKSLKKKMRSSSIAVDSSVVVNVNKVSLGDKLFDLMTKRSEQLHHVKQDRHRDELEKTMAVKTSTKKLSEIPSLDADMERRLLALMKESSSSITMEVIRKKHKVPSTHSHSLKSVVDKTITAGKVEGSVEAIKTALKKLEKGYSREDAEAVCEPGILNQVFKWKNKLRVYLAPFLNGVRYTSFGRHFTKVDKLEEVVNMLHWYVEDDDMIVDFCCGANDFSCLMKKKLEQTGKKCLFKNYDVIQPKNDFNFERKDWMTVCPDELPKSGSQLIMGLNPPFGVKASLANQFINKALEFKPKLLILIVPPETERLDKKHSPYNLVWEDGQFVSGKSFYLPGSIDENDKQMDQWNRTAPPLYLWSRPDWHTRHLAIAQRRGHLSRPRVASSLKENSHETETHHPPDVHSSKANASELTDDLHMQNKELNSDIGAADGSKACSLNYTSDKASQDSRGPGRSQSKEASSKRKHGEGKLSSGTREKFPKKGRAGGKPTRNDTFEGIRRRSPSNIVNNRSSKESQASRSVETSSHAEIGKNNFSNSESAMYPSHPLYGTAYGGNMTSNHDEQSAGHMRESAESIGYRSYVTEIRESDLRSHGRQYGQDPDLSQRSYMGGHDPGYSQMGSLPYSHMSAAAESPYRTNMSTMQRFAPRLDELNHTMMGNFGPDPSLMNRNGIYNPRPPPHQLYHTDSMNFAPGPHRPYSHHNSAGWLNE